MTQGLQVTAQTSVIAFFSMRADGHFRRLLPLIEGVVRRGARAVVYTDPRFAPEVALAGGECVDLFAGRPADGGDPESFPRGVQAVTFAGHHADDVTAARWPPRSPHW